MCNKTCLSEAFLQNERIYLNSKKNQLFILRYRKMILHWILYNYWLKYPRNNEENVYIVANLEKFAKGVTSWNLR